MSERTIGERIMDAYDDCVIEAGRDKGGSAVSLLNAIAASRAISPAQGANISRFVETFTAGETKCLWYFLVTRFKEIEDGVRLIELVHPYVISSVLKAIKTSGCKQYSCDGCGTPCL